MGSFYLKIYSRLHINGCNKQSTLCNKKQTSKTDYSKKLPIVRAHQGTRKPAERASNGQNINNLCNEVIPNYNLKYKYL